MRVTVKIQDPAGNGLATQYIDIPPSEPKILFYNDDPLVGVEYDHALTKKQPIASQEMTLIAEPYYIQAGSRTAPELEYQWNVGGSQETNPGSIILRPSGEGEGEARIQLILTAGGNASARLRGELTFTFSAGGAAATQTGPETIAL
jgi:hypothetical protein